MKNLRDIISNNIASLRRKKGLTQVDLAKKINYSDKAVSRWEKGEVLPDIETLQQVAKVLGVPLEYMFDEHSTEQTEKKQPRKNEMIFASFVISVVWTVISILFVYLKIKNNFIYWQAFVWGVPVTALCCLYFHRKWKNKVFNLVVLTILNWSLIASIYCQFIQHNPWLVFIVGVPIEAAIVTSSFANPKIKDF